MLMEFDNCMEGEGSGMDRREVEINSFGKPPLIASKALNRVTINNTKHDALISFKLCLGTTNSKKSEGSVVASASFHLAEL